MAQRRTLNIGITCYPTFGGSSIVATELTRELALLGHRLHVIALGHPVRLPRSLERVTIHKVEVPEYPLFRYPPFCISLASKMVEVAKTARLDILHLHYAVPHATSAFLARELLVRDGLTPPKVVTTLHGTDITLVGSDPSYLPITRLSIMESDLVTTPSQYLKRATYEMLNIPQSKEITVINNFIDTNVYAPKSCPCSGRMNDIKQKCPKVLIHISNFRPVKRIADVIQIFARVRANLPCRLLMVGDGPERPKAEELVAQLGLSDDVSFMGSQRYFVDLLQGANVLLLPSQMESFGLAALEAMSCAVPVVCSDAGGLLEVVEHGVCGFTAPVGDVETMSQHVLTLLSDDALHSQFACSARKRVLECFKSEQLVASYLDQYYALLGE